MSELDFHAALGEVDTWISYMRGERAATKVGVTGTCMGRPRADKCARA